MPKYSLKSALVNVRVRVVKAVRVIKVVKAFMAVKAVEVDRVMVRV